MAKCLLLLRVVLPQDSHENWSKTGFPVGKDVCVGGREDGPGVGRCSAGTPVQLPEEAELQKSLGFELGVTLEGAVGSTAIMPTHLGRVTEFPDPANAHQAL